MQIGVVYPQTELGGDPDAVRQIGRATEDLGFDYLLAYDHVVGAEHADREPKLWGPYTQHHPFHDPFVMFAYLAGMTERISFATGVLILPQRQTVLVAKQAADLDLLSGERLRLGIGVGWNHVEYTALGQEFTTRGARANEQVELLRHLWEQPLVTFDGRFDQIERGNVIPRPKRTIPIWVGGFSEAAFKRGAFLGDGFMFAGTPAAVIDHGLPRVRELLAEADRNDVPFGLEYVMNAPKTIDTVVDNAKRWRDLGGTHYGVASMGIGLDSTAAHLDFFSQVADQLI
jgi:probable F420-dependent oxidoreductase